MAHSAATSPAPGGGVAPTPAFRPHVPDDARIPELTFRAVALGSLLGIVFGASSLYLFLKVGMTVSASIPVAVAFIAYSPVAIHRTSSVTGPSTASASAIHELMSP